MFRLLFAVASFLHVDVPEYGIDARFLFQPVIYRCTALLRSWSSMQRAEDRDLFMKVSTRLEDTAEDFIIRHGWLHNLRIALPPV